jgi:hypothetical protein
MGIIKVFAYFLWLIYLFIFTLTYYSVQFFKDYKKEIEKYNDINPKTKVYWRNKS